MIWKTTFYKLTENKFEGLRSLFNTFSFIMIFIFLGSSSSLLGQTAVGCDIIDTECPPSDLLEACGSVTVNDVLGNYITWTGPNYSLNCNDGNTYQYQISFDLPEGKENCWKFSKVQRVGTGSGVLRLWSSDGSASGVAQVTSPSFFMNKVVNASMDVFADVGQNFKVDVYLEDSQGIKSGILDSFNVIGNGALSPYTYSVDPAFFDGSGTFEANKIFRLYFEFSAINGTKLNNKSYIEFITIDAGLFGSTCAAEANFAVVSTHSPGDFFPVGTTKVTYTATCNGCVPVLQESCSFDVTVNPNPEITNPGAQFKCDSYTLPTISGRNLSGTQAYYNNSKANNGTKISGPITSTQTVWIYDANGYCSDEESFEITITKSTTSEETQTACDSYSWNGTVYTESGVYTFESENEAGCTNTATLNLTINNSTTSEETQTACDSYSWNGTVYTESGVYTFESENEAGCTNTATLNLTINNSTTSEETQTACDSYSWNGTVYTESGVYTFESENEAGCTNTATLNLTINNSTTSEETQTACDSYSWNGTVYTESGVYTFESENEAGCTNTATLNLTINNSTTSEETQTACDSYSWNGTVYTESGVYTFESENEAGCTNTATLNLTINNSTTSEETQTACDSYSWNGTTYTESGVYTFESENEAGCTNTATLNLTINNSTTSEETQTACDSYSWNGTVYTESGVYTFESENEAGCTNTATLNLTINNSTTSEETQTACDSYSWNGTVYTESGVYTFESENEAGCTNTATLNLTINNSTTSEETQTACDSYSWNGTVYTESGVYTFESENEAGCTNTATLNLTINNSTTSEETQTACDSYSWNGTVYTESGVYTFESENEAGCTNTATLNLTINNSTTSEETQTACDSYSWNGTTYTESGVYTFESENEAGCTNTATLNLTINKTPAAPVVDIKINTTCNLNNGSISLVSTEGIEYSIDGENYQTSGLFSDLAPATYSVTARFVNGVCISASTEIEILAIPDTENPELSEMGDIELNTGAGICGAVVTFSAPTASDNCEGTVVTLNEGSLASGSEFPVGTTTVTYTATDAAGNTTTVSFDVIVTDNQDPTITCPANVNQSTDAGESFAIVTFDDATATDNCDVTVEQTSGLTSGSEFPIGVSTVEFTATDASGNTTTCSFTITITDNDPPTIVCPANIDMDVDAGICGAVVSFETPTATDNSGQEVTVTQTAGPASGEVFPVGTTIVTFTATDAAGNSASCSFEVTVNDTEDPTFGTVADINVNTDTDVCGAVVTFSAPTASDNCEGTVVTLNEGSLASGSEFPVGTTPVTYTATDAAGNTTTVSFDVIVTDNQDPTITCPANVNQSTDAGESFAIVTFDDATATDNCDVTVEQTSGLTSGSQFPIGVSTVEFTATDASGNTTTCSFTITITDNDPPTIVCPANIDMDVDAGICGAVVSFETPTATDNSGQEVTVTQTAGPASGEVFPVGTTIVTFTATDAAGNSASCSFEVTVNDTEDPTFGTVADINVNTDTDVCGAVVTFSAPTASDNCEGTVVTLNEGSLASGSEFPVGTTTVTYTATDAAGNTSTISFDVIVTDNQDPSIICPANVNQSTDAGESFAIVTFDDATATDNCDVTVEQTSGLTSGSEFPIGVSTVEFTATDASGNTTTCSFTITITDNDPPTIVCPANIDMDVDAGICGAVVSFETPTATDNSGQEVTVTQTAGPASGEVFPVGTTIVTFTATDAAGNSASCSFEVTVNDTEDPTFGTVADINVNTDTDVCGAVVTFSAPTASDNCEGTVVTLNEGSLASGSEFPVGTTTVTYTATDAAGNTTTVSFDVIVTDNQDPTITCPSNIVTTNIIGQDYAVVTYTEITATDNCGVTIERTAGLASGAQFPIGTTVVTYVATDASGNTTECSFTVLVKGTPIAVDDAVTTNEDTSVVISVLNNDSDPDGDVLTIISNTNPSNGTVVLNENGTFTYTPNANYNGPDSFEYTISDGNGGTDTATVSITVVPVNDAPVAVDDSASTNEDTPVTVSVLDNDSDLDGDALTVVSTTTPSNGTVVINDNGTITYTPNENFNGTDSFEYTISDGNGGTDTATVTITVNAINDVPVAVDDVATTDEDTSVTIPVLANDSDADGNGLTVISVTTPANGTVVINSDGTVTYTPNANYNGPDSFEYTISDGNGGTDTATVTITVTPVNDAPPAAPTVTVTQPTCENPTGTITVQTIEGLTYSINGVDYQTSGVFTDLAPGIYEVTARDGEALTSEITAVTLNEPTALVIQTTTVVAQCYKAGTYDLSDLLVGDYDETGTWENPNSVGTLNGSIVDLASFENALGTYTFNYVISGNCPSTTPVELTIDDSSCIVLDCSIEDIRDSISKAVTPNGDGFNDYFTIGVDLECGFTFDVKIFNRWGAEIYSMKNYQNNWDGYSDKSFSNSNQLPSGTYYYILEINGGPFEPIQGYIFLGTK